MRSINKLVRGRRVICRLSLTRLCWIGIYKRNSDKFVFLFQWNMPWIEHFIVNQK